MNIIQIVGRLGADPETRFTPSGQKVTSLRLATNSRRGGKEETTWWRITIWGDRFDKMLPYLKKGSALMVVGELKAEIYMDKSGQPQISLEVTADILKFMSLGGGAGERGNQQEGEASAGYPQGKESGDAPFQGFTDYAFNPAGTPQNKQSFSNQSSYGQGSRQSKPPEDDLPF